MVFVDLTSQDLPAAERFDWWREWTRQSMMPTVIDRDGDHHGFHARCRMIDLGPVEVIQHEFQSIRYHRDRRLIQQSDPETLHLALSLRGNLGVAADGRESLVRGDDFVLYDSSRPLVGWASGDDGGSGDGDVIRHILINIPRPRLPLPARQIDRLAVTPMPARHGVGPLLAGYLTTLVRHADRYRPTDALRLATVTVDLVTALCAQYTDTEAAVPIDSRHRVVQARIHDFLQRRLGDPELGPGMIAAAHHISLRHLHKLFHDQGMTVAGRIRELRLERCRADLADPHLSGRPVHAIARRWGFTNSAHFSRLFRATYGMPPGEYRDLAYPAAVHGSASTLRP
ncbi:helix-turn-helix domain-containing protein [Micromonospora cathayae]|uniref:Helix-turn-helix domain-containing protein n=1 Tax=Micromonospora cathayae TaxID=3028804 RepID=A0ABY7ZXV5_9ACTN|nr:helix-turn-helix domain-containing protein [Micromonospora sp. HUAS 3]WDZ87835.1 helix-turn-helix domain-containing protein [Micromonospora sp. HUAS 3]